MKPRSNRMVFPAFGTMIVCLLCFALCAGWAEPRPAPQTAPAKKPLMAEQYFKNIQVLRGIPVNEFMNTMGFIAASTGMNCTDCHVPESGGNWALYAEDTPLKQTARKMIVMVSAINQGFLTGLGRVDCYSCHRGSRLPKLVPDLAEQYAVPPPFDPEVVVETEPNAPSVDQIFDKYIAALGGTERLAALKSFVAQGGYRNYDDPSMYPIDIYAQAPGQLTTILHTPGGDSVTACNGVAAWLAAPQTDVPKPVINLTGQDLDGAKFDANLSFPLRIKQSLSHWLVGPMTTIDGRNARIVQGTGAGGAIIKLYFDPQSGLLLRQLRTSDTPIGAVPRQIDYADYRDVAGVKLPFHWTVTWTDGRNTYQVTKVQPNVPIDRSSFAEPAPSKPPAK